jgi:hypothetical protein
MSVEKLAGNPALCNSKLVESSVCASQLQSSFLPLVSSLGQHLSNYNMWERSNRLFAQKPYS